MSVQRRYTSRDLEDLPDVEGIRYEIIDGELHVSKQPTLGHQYVCVQLTVALALWVRTSGSGRVYGTPGLVFSDDDDVVPDLIWISEQRLSAGRDTSGHITIGPELAVEVLSPGPTNERRDRVSKLQLYSRRNVSEYWIVDWRRHEIQVFRRVGDELALVQTLQDGDTLASPLLPDFALRVVDLWEPESDTPG
jgi:Uma2 family endonuclease